MMAENVNNVIEWQSHKEAAVSGLYKQLVEGNFLDTILFTNENRFIKCHKLVSVSLLTSCIVHLTICFRFSLP